MKKVAITLFVLIIISFACKKKSQYCYWIADGPGNNDYVWEYNKPTDQQVKSFKDTCSCAFTLEEHCLPCKPQTDAGGDDISCD